MKKVIITTGAIAVIGGLATAVSISSCGDDCELNPGTTVTVELVDQDAADGGLIEVSADRVWYQVVGEDGEFEDREVTCEAGRCTLEVGEVGEYEFHAMVCNKQYDSVVTVEFNEETCDLVSEVVEVAISTVDCPDIQAPEPPKPEAEEPLWVKARGEEVCTMEARFSVIASLYAEVDGRMVPIGADRAYYIHSLSDGDGKGKGHDKGKGKGHDKGKGKGHHKDSRGEEIDAICLDESCKSFGAGIELEGELVVGAEACGQLVEATVEVGLSEDGCHVVTEHAVLQFDGSKCVDEPVRQAPEPPPDCHSTSVLESTLMAPSAYVLPMILEGDFYRSHPTADLIYTQGDFRDEGYCAHKAANDKCAMWVAGWGRTGDFVAYTDSCGKETTVSYTVDLAEDGCGPETKYVMALVDTRGCIRTPTPGANPPPDTPAAATDLTQ